MYIQDMAENFPDSMPDVPGFIVNLFFLTGKFLLQLSELVVLSSGSQSLPLIHISYATTHANYRTPSRHLRNPSDSGNCLPDFIT